MENATKALLIAAAVLISVLIITLGIVVYTKAAQTVEGAGDLTEYQAQQFNEKFRKYEGTNETGAEVNALIETVVNHNNGQSDNSTCVQVKVGGAEKVAKSNSILTSPSKVSIGGRYTVKCTLDSKTKLVTLIEITDNSSST